MALTLLDPRTALIVVDLQNGIVGLPSVHPMGAVVENAATLAKAFRKNGLPVVLVRVTGGAPGRNEQAPRAGGGALPADWADLVPALDQQPSDIAVVKNTWGAFTATDLDSKLKEQGVTQVVIVGVSTSVGVESTARQAQELGYNVTLAVDAMTDTNPDTHKNSVERIFPKLGETGCTADVLALLSDGLSSGLSSAVES